MSVRRILALGSMLALIVLALGVANGLSWHGFCLTDCKIIAHNY